MAESTPQEEPDKILLKFKRFDKEISVKVKKTIQFEKVFKAVIPKFFENEKNPERYRFVFDGTPLNGTMNPES